MKFAKGSYKQIRVNREKLEKGEPAIQVLVGAAQRKFHFAQVYVKGECTISQSGWVCGAFTSSEAKGGSASIGTYSELEGRK